MNLLFLTFVFPLIGFLLLTFLWPRLVNGALGKTAPLPEA